jgi:hypothetical protein
MSGPDIAPHYINRVRVFPLPTQIICPLSLNIGKIQANHEYQQRITSNREQ